MAGNGLKLAIGQLFPIVLNNSIPTIYNTPYEMLNIPFPDTARPAEPNRTYPFDFYPVFLNFYIIIWSKKLFRNMIWPIFKIHRKLKHLLLKDRGLSISLFSSSYRGMTSNSVTGTCARNRVTFQSVPASTHPLPVGNLPYHPTINAQDPQKWQHLEKVKCS